MLRKLYYYFLIILCALLLISSHLTISKYSFNHQHVVKNIEYLSSDFFKGRLAGTLENEAAANFIKQSFCENKIPPYKGNYFQSFAAKYPAKVEGVPYLRARDTSSNKIIKEFSYGEDYKEDLLNFKANNISFSTKDRIIVQNDIFQVQKGNDHFLFYMAKNHNMNFRSSFLTNSPHSMYVILSEKSFNEILDFTRKGYSIDCFIPYTTKDTTLRNVVGIIEGRDKTSSPLILSAHFDHIGSDLNGTIYSGSFDNASGVAFLLELSYYIKTLGKPDKNIILVGFNAEEFGLLGSKDFAQKNKQDISFGKLINFDMIGSPINVPLTIMAGKKDSKESPMVKEASSICNNSNVYFNFMFEDSSDHGSFRNQNIDAITLCDADMSKIHTPLDKLNIIEEKSIKRCFSVSSKEILKYSYHKNFLVFYSEYIACSTLILILLLTIIPKKCKNPHE